MLFGTVKGSFTGAENKKGLFEEAHGGTILLDEINSMDTVLQSKLLRVLQEGYIRPIGSSSIIDVDVRILATLNEEPEKLIKEGKLRKDFYYRLSVIRIDIPPLRDRIEDIRLLVSNFIEYYNQILDKNVEDKDEEVLKLFLSYNWPGNIRELKNTIEASMNMIDNNKIITLEYIDNKFIKNQFKEVQHKLDASISTFSLEEYINNLEKEIIHDTLKKYKFNVTKSAEYLKVSRQNLQYKIKKYELL
jgi:arginine utilization regulatory protein